MAPASVCSLGTGDYDFFNFLNGAFPTLTLTVNGNLITGDLAVGVGRAFSPSITVTSSGSSGLMLNSGSAGTVDNHGNRMPLPVSYADKAISWRQH